MEVRPLISEEGLLYREVRLAALADAPDAFSDTLREAKERPEHCWIDRAHQIADSEREVLFLALDQTKAAGLVYVRLESASAHFFGMWIAPTIRRQGHGAALLHAGLSWAKARAAQCAELWVTDGNLAAIKLYQRLGFRDTGIREPIRPGSPTLVCQMILNLNEIEFEAMW